MHNQFPIISPFQHDTANCQSDSVRLTRKFCLSTFSSSTAQFNETSPRVYFSRYVTEFPPSVGNTKTDFWMEILVEIRKTEVSSTNERVPLNRREADEMLSFS